MTKHLAPASLGAIAPSPNAVAIASIPATAKSPSANEPASDFRVLSHAHLFEAREENRCDACGAPLVATVDDPTDVSGGHGVYMWARGDHVRFERVPLCPACASAIGMSALARSEIEEEEG